MKKSLRASYTIEAAVVMPIILFVVGIIIERGITMYQSLEEDFAVKDEVCKTEALETIYRLQTAEDILEELEWK